MTVVPHPLFISSRLMAALTIEGAGVVHLHAEARDDEGRIVYRYLIENASGVELESGTDLRSGVGDEPNYLKSMEVLLTMVLNPSNEDGDHFSPATIAWVEEHESALETAHMDIDPYPSNHPEWCTECVAGNTDLHVTASN